MMAILSKLEIALDDRTRWRRERERCILGGRRQLSSAMTVLDGHESRNHVRPDTHDGICRQEDFYHGFRPGIRSYAGYKFRQARSRSFAFSPVVGQGASNGGACHAD